MLGGGALGPEVATPVDPVRCGALVVGVSNLREALALNILSVAWGVHPALVRVLRGAGQLRVTVGVVGHVLPA